MGVNRRIFWLGGVTCFQNGGPWKCEKLKFCFFRYRDLDLRSLLIFDGACCVFDLVITCKLQMPVEIPHAFTCFIPGQSLSWGVCTIISGFALLVVKVSRSIPWPTCWQLLSAISPKWDAELRWDSLVHKWQQNFRWCFSKLTPTIHKLMWQTEFWVRHLESFCLTTKLKPAWLMLNTWWLVNHGGGHTLPNCPRHL